MFAPVSSDDDEAGSCALYALDAGDGGPELLAPANDGTVALDYRS